MKKLFFANITWGVLSSLMGYMITDLKGFIVWFVGTILVTILAWEND
jgi:hypothetical protein